MSLVVELLPEGLIEAEWLSPMKFKIVWMISKSVESGTPWSGQLRCYSCVTILDLTMTPVVGSFWLSFIFLLIRFGIKDSTLTKLTSLSSS